MQTVQQLTTAKEGQGARNVNNSKTHLAYLDSLRALAAMYVVCAHASNYFNKSLSALPRPEKLIYNFFNHGHFAVSIFIVLSGFCLMLPIVSGNGTLKGGAWLFFVKRARRILPPYYLAVCLCLILCRTVLSQKTGELWDLCVPVTRLGLASHLFLFQDFFEKTGSQIDYSLWSISVEWRIYFAFPLLILLWNKIGPFKTTVVSVFAGYLLLLCLRHTFIYTQENGVSSHYLGLFALGMLASGVAFSKETAMREWGAKIPWGIAAFVSVAMAAVATAVTIHGKPIQVSVLDTIYGLTCAIVIVAASPGQSQFIHRALSWRPLAFVGTFAYSIYLIHPPILTLFEVYVLRPLKLGTGSSFCALYLIVMPLTVASTYLFFLACERPFLSAKKITEVV